MPVLYLFYWVCCVDKGALRWRDAAWWLIYPLLYLGYTLWRGRYADWYPYPFINVIHLGYGRVLLNAAGLVVLFLCLGSVVIAVDRMLSKRTGLQE